MKDGFLRYDRQDNAPVPPMDRIMNYNEFHAQLDTGERRCQAERCMNCGVPFCQSGVMLDGMFAGCPLGNLCPEWNALMAKGLWDEAAKRLLLTSSFPEFTARVCPALCEKACTNGMEGKAVTVKENELAIIENAFSKGLIKPCPPVKRSGKKVAVIGSGPSGLACAQLLNRFGHSVTVYEKKDRPGGLLMYGIPNMKLEKDIIARRIRIMEEEGITFVYNTDIGTDITPDELESSFDAVILCCGSQQPRDIKAPGRELNGIYFAVDFLESATRHCMGEIRDDFIGARYRNVVIIGGGDTGNDCVGTSIRQGCRSVTQLEMMPKPPEERTPNNPWPEWPKVLKTDYGQEEAIAVFGSDPRIYQTTVKSFIPDERGRVKAVETIKLSFEGGKMTQVEGSEQVIPADLVLIAAGFTGAREYVTKAFGVDLTKRNTIATQEGRYASSRSKVFAAGDVRRGQSLVVWAIREGRECAKEVHEYLTGKSI
ncbi:MAG: glutamate synthase subunit beta [Oscillospiraceae bacterium]|nr:glutamate synthase subunit beta [Oscillospiraceae bacterium]